MSFTPIVDEQGFAAFPAPAKLNLFLHLIGRRQDGYHLLQSVFQLIDAHDTIWLRLRHDGQIVHHNPLPGVPAELDLTVRAARLLQPKASDWGVDIRVDKRLPMGGGVGGGSSDAATVLLALNQLWQLDYSRADLMTLGLRLGADVPFFIFGQNAFVEGIGEIMTAIATPPRYFVILHPPVHVSTPEIFKDPLLTRNSPSIKVGDLEEAVTRNDLQACAVRQYPEIAEQLALLKPFGDARMTGSGSCVFVEMPSQAAADAVLSGLLESISGLVVSTLDRHPLYEYAK
ncbi:4-(cytidine 5'-diphospho)-2-C-methyl-D-erythritol kinase [uncultured Deefgea sp.]|uniref:4-(cytidine 5'-diphospho)-2-C-methyl-D-erythritol kinase n=1 Tax=uncultured Deefgea sp. TaxID=1304914 RepID=UPI002604C874|nr:4-(cytidine 5'-diphospho)-2-C-methyl-D-erythritol kinase [uncultured Deefgea sp.]